MEKKFVIYAIKNKINGKVYIGSTCYFTTRRQTHLRQLRNHKHHSSILQNAYNKYGESAFTFIILESLDILDAQLVRQREQKYLDSFKPEYNVSHRADCSARLPGWHHSEEAKRKMQLHHNKKSHPPAGYHHSEETRRKMRVNHPKHHAPSKESGRKTSLWWKTPQGAIVKQKIKDKRPPTLRKTSCVVCHKEIVYRANGVCVKKIPKTCGSVCFHARLKQMVDRRRPPVQKTNCVICHKELTYRTTVQRKIPKTCGQICLKKRQRQLMLECTRKLTERKLNG